MKTVIITGASAGLGREFFVNAAKIFKDAEFWLIARREDKLKDTAELVGEVKSRVIPLDIASEQGLEAFNALLQAEKPDIELLINNAGFGKLGYVDEIDPYLQRAMVSLNCASPTAICAMAVKYMHKGSAIINVASIASFVPNPRMTVYSSTKAYIASFSKGLREELKPKCINVLAVCPGPMRTEFLDVADITDENSKMFRTLPYCDAHVVADKSIKRAMKGKAYYTNKALYKFYRVIAKIVPHNVMMKFAKC